MKKLTSFESHLNKQYGKKETTKREKFESDSLAFRLGEMLKEERKKAKLTQEQLAEKTGTKKVTSQELKQVKAIYKFQPSAEL